MSEVTIAEINQLMASGFPLPTELVDALLTPACLNETKPFSAQLKAHERVVERAAALGQAQYAQVVKWAAVRGAGNVSREPQAIIWASQAPDVQARLERQAGLGMWQRGSPPGEDYSVLAMNEPGAWAEITTVTSDPAVQVVIQHPKRSSHSPARPEVAGAVCRCTHCGLFYTGGSGAVCDACHVTRRTDGV